MRYWGKVSPRAGGVYDNRRYVSYNSWAILPASTAVRRADRSYDTISMPLIQQEEGMRKALLAVGIFVLLLGAAVGYFVLRTPPKKTISPAERQQLLSLRLEKDFAAKRLDAFLVRPGLKGRAADDIVRAAREYMADAELGAAVHQLRSKPDPAEDPGERERADRAAATYILQSPVLEHLTNATAREDVLFTPAVLGYKTLFDPQEFSAFPTQVMLASSMLGLAGDAMQKTGNRDLAERYYRAMITMSYIMITDPNFRMQMFGATVLTQACLKLSMSRKAVGDQKTSAQIAEALEAVTKDYTILTRWTKGMMKAAEDPDSFEVIERLLEKPAFRANLAHITAFSLAIIWSEGEIASGTADPKRKALLKTMSGSSDPFLSRMGKVGLYDLDRIEKTLADLSRSKRQARLESIAKKMLD